MTIQNRIRCIIMAQNNSNQTSKETLQLLEEAYDNLNSVLQTLQHNTQVADDWFRKNRHDIVQRYTHLYTALQTEQTDTIQRALKEISDKPTHYMALSLNGLDTQIEKFTPVRKAGSISQNLPPDLLMDIKTDITDEILDVKPENEQKGGFLTRIFTGKETRQLQEKMDEAAGDLLALQSENPYYIDSFFENASDKIFGPEDGEAERDPRSYKNPKYVLNKAKEDFENTLKDHANTIGELAQCHAELKMALISESTDKLTEWHKTYVADKNQLATPAVVQEALDLVMAEYHAASPIEVCLLHFQDTKKTATALSLMAPLGQPTLHGEKSVSKVYTHFLDWALNKKDPLPADTFMDMVTYLKQHEGESPLESTIVASDSFARITKEIEEPGKRRNFLKSLVTTLYGGKADVQSVITACDFVEALETKDTQTARHALTQLVEKNGSKGRENFMSLYSLMLPKQNPVADLVQTFGLDNEQGADLVSIALKANMKFTLYHDALYKNGTAVLDSHSTETFLQQVPEKDIPARLIADVIHQAGLDKDTYRDILLKGSNAEPAVLPRLLHNMKTSGNNRAIDKVGAVLAPFNVEIERVNLIAQAAAQSNDLKDIGDKLTKELAGHAFKVKDGKGLYLSDTPVTSIYWKEDAGVVISTPMLNGQLIKMSNKEAENFFELMERTGQFISAYDEFLNPNALSWIMRADTEITYAANGEQHIIQTDSDDTAIRIMQAFDQCGKFSRIGNILANRDNMAYVHVKDDFSVDTIDKHGFCQSWQAEDGFTTDTYINTDHFWFAHTDQGSKAISLSIDSAAFEKTVHTLGTDDTGLLVLDANHPLHKQAKKDLGKANTYYKQDDVYLNLNKITSLQWHDQSESLLFVNADSQIKQFDLRDNSTSGIASHQNADAILADLADHHGYARMGDIALRPDMIDNAWMMGDCHVGFILKGHTQPIEFETESVEETKALLSNLARYTTLRRAEDQPGDYDDYIRFESIHTLVQDEKDPYQVHFLAGSVTNTIHLHNTPNSDYLDQLEESYNKPSTETQALKIAFDYHARKPAIDKKAPLSPIKISAKPDTQLAEFLKKACTNDSLKKSGITTTSSNATTYQAHFSRRKP